MSDDDDFDEGEYEAHDHFGGLAAATTAGTAYALYRHGQDRQVQQIAALMQQAPKEEVHANTQEIDTSTDAWDGFIGQEHLKRQLKVYIDSAKKRDDRLPHILLASGFPGVGKTHMSRLIAKEMDVRIVELMPPFDVYTLVEAAKKLPAKGILFIDEIHKLADSGKRGAESLLKVLEEGVAFLPTGARVNLPNITIIGATTDRDKLPEPVIDRFKVKPTFAPYQVQELALIAVDFACRHWHEEDFSDDAAFAVADACRGVPRIAEEMVIAHRDLGLSLGREPDEAELLEFLDLTWDGLTRNHVNYMKFLFTYFKRETDDGTIYIAGEPAIKQMLRETTNGLNRLEAFLLERGYIDRTPRGRQLTPSGVNRITELIEEGHA